MTAQQQAPVEAEPSLATEQLTLNMGPQHPSTHGVLRCVLTIDGEVVRNVVPHIGYLHSSCEKLMESRTYAQILPLLDRFDYLAANFYGLCAARAVEELLAIEVPPRARWLRTLVCELNRIASHLLWVATFALDLGAQTVFLYAFRDREYILDLMEDLCGARLTYNYFRIGGVSHDLPDDGDAGSQGFEERARWYVGYLPERLDEIDRILTGNRIFIARSQGVGTITAEQAIDWGLSGPMLRACGVDFDLRKAHPYEAYGEVDFDVITRDEGDVLARYWVRMDEMRECLKIIQQALGKLPEGETLNAPKGRLRPEGEVYSRVESPRGELGMYVIAEGETTPYRWKVRGPSFCNLAPLNVMAQGSLVADLVAILGSVDIVLGDVDR